MKDLCWGLFVWYTLVMHKPIYIAGVLIVYLSIAGIVYSAFNPTVDMCASSSNVNIITTPVCYRQESTNWMGYGISLAALVFGVILIAHGLKGVRKQKIPTRPHRGR